MKKSANTWDEPVQYDSIATVTNTISPRKQNQFTDEEAILTPQVEIQPDVQLEKKIENLSLSANILVNSTEEVEDSSLQPDQFFLLYQCMISYLLP